MGVDSDRVCVYAKRWIVAVPPTLAGRILYDPLVSTVARPAHPARRPGTLTKAVAVYRSRSGATRARARRLDLRAGDRDARHAPPNGSPGVVFGSIGGDDGRAHRSSAWPGGAARCWTSSRNSSAWRRRSDWLLRDRLDRGRVVARLPGGDPPARPLPPTGPSCASRRALPLGGTETSNYWNGYMDGAVRWGERAAGEVLDKLSVAPRGTGRSRRRRGARACGAAARRARSGHVPPRPGAGAGDLAMAYLDPNGRTTSGTYETAGRHGRVDALRVRGRRDAAALWKVPGQTLSALYDDPGATSDARGRTVLLDRTPSRALLFNPIIGAFRTYATLAQLPGKTRWPPTTRPGATTARSTSPTTPRRSLRVPPGGGAAKVWLSDPRLDGGTFGTMGSRWAPTARRST